MDNTAKTLDAQIQERKQQAEDRNIFSKARLVAEKLGKRGHREDHGSFSRIMHTFNDAANSLVVRYEEDEDYRKDPEVSPYFDRVIVSYKGKEVYQSSGDYSGFVRAYLPGAWEKKLDYLQPKAKRLEDKERAAARREAAKAKKSADDAKRKQWGL